MQLTIDNKMTLIYALLFVLFFAISHIIFSDRNDQKEHLDPTSGNPYIHNEMSGVRLNNLDITGKISLGKTILDQDGISIGNKIDIEDKTGKISIGQIKINKEGDINIGKNKFVDAGGNQESPLEKNYVATKDLIIGGTTLSVADGSIITKGDFKLGNLIMDSDGSVKLGSNEMVNPKTGVVKLNALNVNSGKVIINDDDLTAGNITCRSLNVSNTGSLGATKAPSVITKDNVFVDVDNGDIIFPHNVKLSTFADNHVELITSGGAIIYTADGLMRSYKKP